MFRFEVTTIILWICLLMRGKCIADPASDERLSIVVDCSRKTNFPLEQVPILIKRDYVEPFPMEFKCWMNCIYERYGGLINGTLAPKEHVKMYLLAKGPTTESEYEIFTTCFKQSEHETLTHCERAFKIYKCTMDKRKSG